MDGGGGADGGAVAMGQHAGGVSVDAAGVKRTSAGQRGSRRAEGAAGVGGRGGRCLSPSAALLLEPTAAAAAAVAAVGDGHPKCPSPWSKRKHNLRRLPTRTSLFSPSSKS